jgi:hypothetical protein
MSGASLLSLLQQHFLESDIGKRAMRQGQIDPVKLNRFQAVAGGLLPCK